MRGLDPDTLPMLHHLTRITCTIVAAGLVMAAPLEAQSFHQGPSTGRPLHVDPTLEECSVIFASSLTQGAFRRFAREFGSVSAFRQSSAASTLGRGRISLGVEMMRFSVDQWADAWHDTFAHPDEHHALGSRQDFPKLSARVGVTDHLDVGAFWTRNPMANYGWLGVDAKQRVLTEGHGMPVSLAVRGAYTKTLYVSDMDMHALTADVSIERRVAGGFRPYIGVGADGVFVRETSDAVALRDEREFVPHAFAGFEVTVLRRITLGAEHTRGALSSTQVQVGAVLF